MVIPNFLVDQLLSVHDVRASRVAECGKDHYQVKSNFFFPLIPMYSKKQPQMKTQEVHEIRYNLDSLKDESTAAFLYKLSNIICSSGPYTYENIAKCKREAAMGAIVEQQRD